MGNWSVPKQNNTKQNIAKIVYILLVIYRMLFRCKEPGWGYIDHWRKERSDGLGR